MPAPRLSEAARGAPRQAAGVHPLPTRLPSQPDLHAANPITGQPGKRQHEGGCQGELHPKENLWGMSSSSWQAA